MGRAAKEIQVRKPRIALRGPVRVAQRGAPSETYEFTDLSMGGLFVKTMFPPELGTKVAVGLRLSGLPYKAVATVTWVRRYKREADKPEGMGLTFRKVSPSQKKALYHQIKEALAHGCAVMPGTPPSRDEVAARRPAPRKPKRRNGLSWVLEKFL